MALSEFRKNLVSGEWVLFATGRARRPRNGQDNQHVRQDRATCPFEDFASSGHELVWKDRDSDDWQVAVVKNKYPAVKSEQCGPDEQRGPYTVHAATGAHDILVLRDHEKQLHMLVPEEMLAVVRAYKRRKRELSVRDGCTKYVMVFHNFGAQAGASIWHPHSQILSTPILPPSVTRSLFGAYRFYQEHGEKVYDVMMLWEKEQKTRVVFENDFFIAFCPFASKRPAEIRIFPKSGSAHFEEMPDEMDNYFAEALSVVLRKLAGAFEQPAYNFYIHSSPTEQDLGDIHEYYTWHVEILPKLKIDAGFELGTGVDVNIVDPDEAARQLREFSM